MCCKPSLIHILICAKVSAANNCSRPSLLRFASRGNGPHPTHPLALAAQVAPPRTDATESTRRQLLSWRFGHGRSHPMPLLLAEPPRALLPPPPPPPPPLLLAEPGQSRPIQPTPTSPLNLRMLSHTSRVTAQEAMTNSQPETSESPLGRR